MTHAIKHENGSSRSEKRRHRRFACDGAAEVFVFASRSLFRGRIRDLSESGCFFATRAWLNLRRNAEVELRFTVNGVQIAVVARAMDVRPGGGAGFEFLPDDPRMEAAFPKLIEKLDPAAVKA